MRILQVVPSYAPAWAYGGPARVVYELSTALHQRGHQVTVYTTDAFLPTALPERVEQTWEEGVRVVRMRNISRKAAERLRLFWPHEFSSLMNREIGDFDIIHIHEYRTFYNDVIRRVAHRAHVPYVLSTHGAATLNGQREHAKYAFDWVMGKKILREARAVFALTSLEATDLAGMRDVSCPVSIIPNGVQIPPTASNSTLVRQRQHWGVEDSQKVILYFGRIARTKGVDLLLRALAVPNPELDNAHAVICGPDDGAATELEALASHLGLSSRVTFAEPIYGDDRHIAFQVADVVVVPSFTGLPIVLLEAAANARPAVTATDASGLDWLDGSGGISTEPHPSALSDALIRILNGPSRAMGSAARAIVKRLFSWESIAASYEDHYRATTSLPLREWEYVAG